MLLLALLTAPAIHFCQIYFACGPSGCLPQLALHTSLTLLAMYYTYRCLPRLPLTMALALDVSSHILALDPFPVKAPILHHPHCGTLVLHATQGPHVSSHNGLCSILTATYPVMASCVLSL